MVLLLVLFLFLLLYLFLLLLLLLSLLLPLFLVSLFMCSGPFLVPLPYLQSRVIRLPVHVHDFLNSVRKATRELTDKNGKLPTDEDLSFHLDTTVVKIQVRFCFNPFRSPESLPILTPNKFVKNRVSSCKGVNPFEAPKSPPY